MNRTENLRLFKPEGTEGIDIDLLNENADVLDAEVASRVKIGQQSLTDAQKSQVRENIGAVSESLFDNGALLIANGGTGAKTASDARTALGIGDAEDVTSLFSIAAQTENITISSFQAKYHYGILFISFNFVPTSGTIASNTKIVFNLTQNRAQNGYRFTNLFSSCFGASYLRQYIGSENAMTQYEPVIGENNIIETISCPSGVFSSERKCVVYRLVKDNN